MSIVAVLTALGDRSRLMIIRELAHGSLPVGELVARLPLAQSTISGHLAVLRYSGLVTVQVRRNHRIYSLAHPEALEVIGAAENLVRSVESGRPSSTHGCKYVQKG